ncbi:MAG: ABC transporter permease [Actinomycetota bacterium]
MSAVAVETAGTASADQAPIRRGKGRRWTSYILPTYTWVVIVYLAFPIAVMIVFGFNDVPGRVSARWYGFTTQWYTQLFDNTELTAAFKNSIGIAVISSAVSTLIGALLGLALGRYRFKGAPSTNYLVFLAIASPEIVLGTSLLTMFVNAYTFIPQGFPTILVSHIAFSISFVAVTVRARVQGLSSSYEEAAQDLGADPLNTFRLVTLPLIMPSVISGFLLAFALSVDDFVITSFVAGPTVTFPLYVAGAAKQGIPPQVNVMGTILFSVGVLAAISSAVAPAIASRRDAKRLSQDRELTASLTASVGSKG